MSTTAAEIRVRVAGETDEPAIAALLDRAFGVQRFDQRRALWAWRSRDNPAQNGAVPGFLVAVRDGAIVAVHGLLPLRLSVDGEVLTASTSCDLAVDPAARSAGLRLKLAAMDGTIAALHISTSANRPANAIMHALGGRDIPGVRRRHMKILRVDGLARRSLADRLGRLAADVAAGATAPVDIALSIGRVLRRTRLPAGTRVEPVARFDDRFDSIKTFLAQCARVAVVRDSAYLDWRYGRYPFGGTASFALLRGEMPLGIGVLHTGIDEDGLTFASILDLVADPTLRGARSALLDTLVTTASRNGAHYMTAWSTLPALSRALRGRGFLTRSLDYSPATWRSAADPAPAALLDPTGWYISLGDGDASFLYR